MAAWWRYFSRSLEEGVVMLGEDVVTDVLAGAAGGGGFCGVVVDMARYVKGPLD